MRHFTPFTRLIIAFVLLAACTPQPQTLPTLIPTSTIPSTEAAPDQTATSEPTRRIPPTFPPTWTPAGEAVETQTAVATEAENIVEIIPPTALEQCGTLGEDFAQNTRSFPLGSAPLVVWTGVEGAAAYHIALIAVDAATPDAPPTEVFADFTSETSYTFSPELFETRKFYGWEVYPLDGIGQQMCQSVGAELFPTAP
jgi:hypothetical protein